MSCHTEITEITEKVPLDYRCYFSDFRDFRVTLLTYGIGFVNSLTFLCLLICKLVFGKYSPMRL